MKVGILSLLIFITSIAAGIYFYQQKEKSELAITLNPSSASYASSSESSISATENISSKTSKEDLERIQLAVEMRKTAEEVYGDKGKNTGKVESDSEIRPNKFTRLIVNKEGEKLLKLLPITALPRITMSREHLNCPYYGDLPLEDLKKGAERGEACMYQHYGAQGLINIRSQELNMAKNREEWKVKLKPYHEYLIKAAQNGNPFSAVAIGCSYIYEPFVDKVEGLAWYMVASAMVSYQLMGSDTCTEVLLNEPQQSYIAAVERAKFLIDYYDFRVQ